jgi:hypothetical protein
VLTIVAALIHSRGLSVQDFYAILGIDTSRHDNHESAAVTTRLNQIIRGFPDLDPHH